jgi:hypothetical protein
MSKLRNFVKLITPPIISKWRQARLRNRQALGPYDSYEAALAQVKNDAFSGAIWEMRTHAKLLAFANDIREKILPQHQVVLAALVGQLSTSGIASERSLKVVDWGGSRGAFRRHCFWGATCGEAGVCRGRNSRLIGLGQRARPAVKFVDCTDEETAFREARNADILFMSSVLHYIPQWKTFLHRLSKECHPGLLYIARHYSPDALDESAFATQKIYTPSGYAGEAVLQLLPEKRLAEQLAPRYRQVLSTVTSVPDYFPSTFDALRVVERNILFCRNDN